MASRDDATTRDRRGEGTSSAPSDDENDARPLLEPRARDAGARARATIMRGAHPLGLVVLGATEMWERFGYYAARALLALYVTKVLRDPTFDVERVLGLRTVGKTFSNYDFAMAVNASDAVGMMERTRAAEATSAKTYGAFACLAYLTPVFGGIVADAVLGAHRSAVVGAVVMALGYGAMASEWAFLIGLALVCVGNGAFKPSISTQLSALYAKDDPKRDAGFSIFYCCINVGAFFSPLIAGTVRVYFGYGAAFASAAVGMWCALAIYALNRRHVVDAMIPASANDNDEESRSPLRRMGSNEQDFEEENGRSNGESRKSLNDMARLIRENSNAMFAVAIVCVAGIGFSMVYEQSGSTLMLFSDEHVDLHGMPTEFIAALNPLLVLSLTPAVTALWDWQARRGAEPHQMSKIAIGCALLSSSFAVLMFGALPIDSHASPTRVSVFWIVLNQIFLTAGELFTFPVALSYISKIAPDGLLSAIIGLWFGSYFFGNYFSGVLGSTYPSFDSPSGFFAALALIAGAVALVLGLARAPLAARCPT